MATKNSGEQITVSKLENQIALIKYTLFCLNIITWLLGIGLFAVSIWLRAEPGFQETISKLELQQYYIGVYILMFISVVMVVVSFLGCAAALTEIYITLVAFIGTQIFGFIFGVVGSAVLLDYGTVDSKIQPLIRDIMNRLIMQASYDWSSDTLSLIQESIGCCGADGANDYQKFRQPLPSECRDTVTGNVFFHGCVDELTWYMQGKSVWCSGIALVLCLLCVVNSVLAGILIEALKKEEREALNGYNPDKRYQ